MSTITEYIGLIVLPLAVLRDIGSGFAVVSYEKGRCRLAAP